MWKIGSVLGAVRRHLWLAVLVVTTCIAFFPVGYWAMRACLVASSITLWIWGVYLLRGRRLCALAGLATGITSGVWLCLPGRPGDPADLQRSYVRCLKRYEGTRYVWGGENRLGIDCSGLVRKGLIIADIKTGLLTLNPQLVRTALDIWWNDCSANALLEGYRGYTIREALAARINDIPVSSLMPGDLAVTAGGAHVLAYLGDKTWIEADPDVMRVITVSTPSDNPWFKLPVQIVRWKQLVKSPTPASRASGSAAPQSDR